MATLGCGCLTTKDDSQNELDQCGASRPSLRQRGATRLLQITISEATHLIWVLRCERVIQEKTHSNREVGSRWYKAINRRLTNEKIIVTIIKKKDKPFTQLVKATWEGTLKKQSDLLDEWIKNHEVLVGMSV